MDDKRAQHLVEAADLILATLAHEAAQAKDPLQMEYRIVRAHLRDVREHLIGRMRVEDVRLQTERQTMLGLLPPKGAGK